MPLNQPSAGDGSIGLGLWIKSNRKVQELSQRDLAQRASISRSYLCDIEHGRGAQPSLFVLEKLAIALGATSTEILRAAGILRDGHEAVDHSHEYRLLSLYRDLSAEGRVAVERFARFVHIEEQRWIQTDLLEGQEGQASRSLQEGPGLFDAPEPSPSRKP
ncbi:MAG: helix-turn-helix domain-containing protein [Thermomicrobiales bacterium]